MRAHRWLVTLVLAGAACGGRTASRPAAVEPAPAVVAPGPHEPGPDEPGPDEPGPDEPGPDEPGLDERASVIEPPPTAAAPATARPTAEQLAAAERMLRVAEAHYEQVFVPFQLTTPARDLAEAKAFEHQLACLTVETQDRYHPLAGVGIPEYAAAATVRFGETLWLHAEKMLAQPPPLFILAINPSNPTAAIQAWRDGLAANLLPYRESARTAWREVVATELRHGVNDWTRLARANLARAAAMP